jgi:AcrR family transcriptional regulator
VAGSRKSSRGDLILEVAMNLFFEKGYGHVGIDEIGEAAGLSGPAIYRYFSGKGEILAALFDQAIDGLLSVSEPPTNDPWADLGRLVRAHVQYVLTHDKLSSVWIREGRSLSPDHRSRFRRRERNHIRHWTEIIQRCYPNLTEKQSEVASLTALSTLNSLSSWPRHGSREGLSDAMTEFVISGLERLGRGSWDQSSIAV